MQKAGGRMETLLYDVKDGVLTLTLNRPEKLNAYTRGMADELVEAFDASDRDDAVKAVIVTGAGRAFGAGFDLSGGAASFDFGAGEDDAPDRPDGSIDYTHPLVRDIAGQATLRIHKSLKPVIAAINGPAVGVGATMLLPMDMRLASTKAKFGFVFTQRGIVPEGASAFFLPRVVGINRALEWTITGRMIGAEEAREAGLVRSIHEPDDLLPAAQALAQEIVRNTAPVSVALTRQMMWHGLGMSHPMEAHRVDSRGVFVRGRSADANEGVTSFLEKRRAIYTDKVSDGMPDFFPWWDEPEYR